jgi:hypothetical protein
MAMGSTKKTKRKRKIYSETFITDQLENPRESYEELTDDVLNKLIDVEVITRKHRSLKRVSPINDNNIKDMYLANALLRNVILVLSWDNEIEKQI